MLRVAPFFFFLRPKNIIFQEHDSVARLLHEDAVEFCSTVLVV